MLTSGSDFDQGAVFDDVPHLLHVGVAHGDAAIGPVEGLEVPLRVFVVDRRAVDHNHAAGRYAFFAGLGFVAAVGVGNVHGQVVVLAGFAPVDPVQAFWGALITFTQLWPLGLFAQGDAVGFDHFATADELQLMGRFEHQDLVDALRVERRRSGIAESGKR